MSKYVQMYCGTGKGKTGAALGRGIQEACGGKTVYIIRFLKGKETGDTEFLKRLEPELKIFSFDKFRGGFAVLTEEEKAEERIHLQTGLTFARKVMTTGECDVLILDEILDLGRNGVVKVDDLIPLIEKAGENMELILTGTDQCISLWPYMDKVTEVKTMSEKPQE